MSDDPRDGAMKIPFNAMDEMFMNLDDPARPLVIQIEVRIDGRLDEERTRKAIHVAAGRHPLARARLEPWTSDAKTYMWLVDDEPQIDPLRVIEVGDAADLDDVRSDLYSRAIPLLESPPFRAVLVHEGDADLLMLAINHTACDGIGALRFLQSVGRAYAGVPDPTAEIDPAEAHQLAVPESEGPGIGERIDRGRLGLQQLAQMRSRLAKVAAKDGSASAGYGVHTMSLPITPLLTSPMRRRVGATLNDVILAAVHRSIDLWNREQGVRAGRISIGMPVNARPEAWRFEVMRNLITSEMVSTLANQRQSPEACLAAVTGWTEAMKRRGSGSVLAAQSRGLGGRVSHRRAFAPVVKTVAGFISGTAAVSNLGPVPPDWVDSPDFEVLEVWVGPPAFGVALAVGAVSVNDMLNLALRYTASDFSRHAASEFAVVLQDELAALCGA